MAQALDVLRTTGEHHRRCRHLGRDTLIEWHPALTRSDHQLVLGTWQVVAMTRHGANLLSCHGIPGTCIRAVCQRSRPSRSIRSGYRPANWHILSPFLPNPSTSGSRRVNDPPLPPNSGLTLSPPRALCCFFAFAFLHARRGKDHRASSTLRARLGKLKCCRSASARGRRRPRTPDGSATYALSSVSSDGANCSVDW
jgi:hypothetical protein